MRNKRLYNYLVNTLELSKENILKHVEERIESIVARHLVNKLDSKAMEKIILDRVTDIVKNGFEHRGAYYRTQFDDYVANIVESVTEKRLNKEYKLEVKMIDATKKTIARSKRRKR